jgi:23S rRNA (guanosine2251-2'-O)-methyltransferase
MSFNRDDKKRYYGKKTDRGSFGAGRKPFRGDFDKKSTPYNDTDAAKEELSGWKSTGSNLDDNTQKIAPVDLMENIESAESIKQNYLFGMHPVLEAVKSGKAIEKVLLKKGLEGELFRELLTLLDQNKIAFQFVPSERLDRVTKGRHQGVVAYLPNVDYVPMEEAIDRAIKKASQSDSSEKNNPIVLLLDGVTDVRNLGAIARTAECMGVSSIILPAKGGAAINPDAIKASAGALLRIDVCKVSNLKMALFYLKQMNFKIVASTEKVDKRLFEADFSDNPIAIILGSEGKGISDSLRGLSDEQVRIPMIGDIESLNVSASAAIVLYEVIRQRSR